MDGEKKNMTTIKRVNVKGKYYWFLRDKGKILERRKWSPKKEVKEEVYNYAKQNNSLYKFRTNNVLVNVVEKTRFSTRGNVSFVKKKKEYMVEVRIFIKGTNKEGFGRSLKNNMYSYDEKREQALTRAMEVFQGKVINKGSGSDPNVDETQRLLDKGLIQKEERVVYYASR